MIAQAATSKIASLFGMQGLNTGPQLFRDSAGNELGISRVLYYWVAEISYYTDWDHLIVAVMKSPELHKGLILIPALDRQASKEFGGPDPLYALDLGTLDDQVIKTLKSLDVVPDGDIEVLGSAAYYYELLVGTRQSYLEFSFHGPTINPSLGTLWEAMKSAVYQLVVRYDDAEMHKFLLSGD